MRGALRRVASDFGLLVASWRRPGPTSTRSAMIALAVLVPGILLVVTKALGIGLGYSAIAETMLFPILVGAAWGGGLGALAVGAVAMVLVSPIAVHQFFRVQDAVSSTGWWAFQGAVFATFAGMSTALVSRPDKRQGLEGKGVNPVIEFEGYRRILASLAKTVEVRDHHTQGHCERVARNALVMGHALGISSTEASVLYWAARLHDLGKIAVPEYILLKNGRLTEDEFAEIRRHPAYGADLLASVSVTFRPIADVVRAHHERWDGLGYPLGFRAEEIPRLARVIAIVDVFEALTSERPYRSPMPATQALQYIRNGAGTQFDPDLVAEFEQLYYLAKIECAGSPSDSEAHQATASKRLAYHRA